MQLHLEPKGQIRNQLHVITEYSQGLWEVWIALRIFLKNVSWSRFQMAKAGPDGVSKWGCSPDILFGNVSLNF